MRISVNSVVIGGCGWFNPDVREPGEIIRERRERKGLTQGELASKASVSPSTIQNAENPVWAARAGRSLLKRGTMFKIARALEIDEHEATREWERIRDLVVKENGDDASAPIQLPPAVIGEVAASGFVEKYRDDGEVERLPRLMPEHPNAEALRIVGDSMAPEYLPGDVIIIEPIDASKIQPGDDLVIQCDDDQSAFKRVEKIRGDVIYLRPLNKSHKSISIACANVHHAMIHIGTYRAKRRA